MYRQTTSSPIRSLRVLIAFKHFAVYLNCHNSHSYTSPLLQQTRAQVCAHFSQSSKTITTRNRNMKITTILPILAATLATSSILPGFASKSQAIISSSELSVPGKNPLNFCADPTNYVLTIDHVDLSPNPPVPGQTLNISAAGTFNADVEPGATIFLQVKFGLITLIKTEADLCDQLGNVDVTCPLEKGNMTLSKSVNIPERVPKGKYTVIADVKTVDGDPVTCMTSEISFS
jgi:hypothetical protein